MSDEGRLPNFFILGAAKAGTTTLVRLLSSSGRVYIPPEKEPEFFSRDLYYQKGMAHYLRHYPSRNPAQARGDATPQYLLHAKVAERIRRDMPDSAHRFVVIFRDPVQRAYSWYWHQVREGVETLTFEEALEAEEERISSGEWAAEGRSTWAYFRGGCYADQLDAYFEHFSPSRFLFLLTEDLREPSRVYRILLDFLGIDSRIASPAPESVRMANRSSMPRFPAFHRFLNQPSVVKKAFTWYIPDRWRIRIKNRLREANLRSRPNPPLGPAIERVLRDRYRDQIERLSRQIGRDLGAWL